MSKGQSHSQEELEDTKGTIRIRISKKNSQDNRSTKHTHKTGVNSGAPEV